MHTKSESASARKDAIVCGLAVAILLIGTATNSAIAMLVMSVIGLSMMAVFYRDRFSGRLLVSVAVAAIIGIFISLIISMQ